MSTQRLLPKMRKGMGRSVVSPLSLLAGVLLLWQLALPSVALAFQIAPKPTPTPTSNITSTVVPPSTPATTPVARPTPLAVPQDPAQALAQVSVVRLVASYMTEGSATGGGAGVTICTGLGVLVGSWPVAPGSTALTNWVLTDSAALGSKNCPAAGGAKVLSIQVLANAVYTNTPTVSSPPFSATLVSMSCATTPSACQVFAVTAAIPPVPCTNLTQCSGPVLFAFASPPTTRPQPFVALGTTDTVAHLGIQLTNPAGEPFPTAAKTSSAEQYLAPTLFADTDSALTSNALAQSEIGMPVFNKEGQLVEMHLSTGSLDLTNLSAFLNTSPVPHANPLNTAWMQGINAFYGINGQPKDLSKAIAQFQTAQTANSAFQAATFMKNAAINGGGKVTSASTPTTGPAFPSSVGFFGIPFWVLAIVGIVVLLAIFVLMSLSFGQKRAQKRREYARFKAEELEAQRRAEIEVQHSRMAQQASLAANKSSTINPPSPSETRCPNCGQGTPANATFCPNCRYPLVPLVQSSNSPLRTLPIQDWPISNQVPKPAIIFQASQEIVTEPIQDDRIVRETLRRLWDREGR